jgi:hypothetical protein
MAGKDGNNRKDIYLELRDCEIAKASMACLTKPIETWIAANSHEANKKSDIDPSYRNYSLCG